MHYVVLAMKPKKLSHALMLETWTQPTFLWNNPSSHVTK